MYCNGENCKYQVALEMLFKACQIPKYNTLNPNKEDIQKFYQAMSAAELTLLEK
jgi:hypothetical protein